MFVKQAADGNWYVARRTCKRLGRMGKREISRNWFFVKAGANLRTMVSIGNVCFPKKFFGKKIRFKIEEVDE